MGRISISIPDELKEQLKRAADAQGKTLTAFLIDSALAATGDAEPVEAPRQTAAIRAGNDAEIKLTLPAELKARLKQYARNRGRTVSACAVEALEAALGGVDRRELTQNGCYINGKFYCNKPDPRTRPALHVAQIPPDWASQDQKRRQAAAEELERRQLEQAEYPT